MRLWIHLDDERYQQLANGVLRADPERVITENGSFIGAYAWMVKQMAVRVGEAPDGVRLPVWAWRAFGGVTKAPDLRSWAFTGDKGWLVEVEVADERVLLSDFHLWHFVLNNWYLPMSEEEARVAEDDNLVGEWEVRVKQRIKELENEGFDWLKAVHMAYEEVYGKSWEQIFDMGYAIGDYTYDDKELQATIWELRKEDIVKSRRINRAERPNDYAVKVKREEQNRKFRENVGKGEYEERWEEVLTW